MTTEKPVTFMDHGEADLMRAYEVWLDRNELERRLWCTHCQSPAEVHVTPADIGIICECRVLLWKAS